MIPLVTMQAIHAHSMEKPARAAPVRAAPARQSLFDDEVDSGISKPRSKSLFDDDTSGSGGRSTAKKAAALSLFEDDGASFEDMFQGL